jgi:quinoprotein glucose dehydrogenase
MWWNVPVMRRYLLLGVAVALAAVAFVRTGTAAGGGQDGEWPAYSGTNAATKYSPLDQINQSSVSKLQIAWKQSSIPDSLRAAFPDARGATNWQNTPLMVGGLLYMSSAVGAVVALDPATGKVVWTDIPPSGPNGKPVAAGSTRGVAYWNNGNDSRIFTTVGSNLVALNAKTGKRYPAWGTGGQVDLTKVGYDRPGITGYRFSSAPIVIKGVVVVGGVPAPATDYLNEIGKATKEAPPGDIRGFDAKTGKHLWTFHVVPRKGEFGADTWLDGSADFSGNSGVWTLLSGDDDLGYVYLPTEEATGDYYGGTRPGDNLFAESIVCLDVKTGKRVWHFQTLHHGLWDYDLPAAPILMDIRVDGKRIKAVAQLTKQGYVFVFDRVTGKPVWPIEERPVPKGEAPGEWYAPTQPVPLKPPPFEVQGVSDADVLDHTPELKAEALEILKGYHYGPLYTPPELWGTPKGKGGTINVPGGSGGADWSGGGFDPETGMLYVPSTHSPRVVGLVPSQHAQSTMPLVRRGASAMIAGPRGLPDPFKPPYSRLVAIDMNKGDIAWTVPNGDGLRKHPAFAGRDPGPVGTPGRSAPLVTKDMVFLGEGSDTGAGMPPGSGGKKFRAFDKRSGKIVWEMDLPAGISNAPMTYMLGKKQYIVVAVSGRTYPGELVALALP